MTSINEIDNAHIGLACVFTVQTPSVLLQRALPRDRHCQYQSIKRWMVKSLADKLAGG